MIPKTLSLLARIYAYCCTALIGNGKKATQLHDEQLHFLMEHERTLSKHALGRLIQYYLRCYQADPDQALPLLFPQQKLDKVTTHQIKHCVQELLQHNLSHVDLKITLEQFKQFKALGLHELIFWFGNHFLTGAPFYPSGIAHTVYFQWGNLFGVARQHILGDEKAIKGNLFIYFEDMNERDLYQCVIDYANKSKQALEQQNKHANDSRFMNLPKTEQLYAVGQR